MLCVRYKVVSRINGITNVVANIVANEKPDPFPVTGATVDNLDDTYVLLPGSRLMALEEGVEYIMAPDDGKWYKWSKAGSGGGGGGDDDTYTTEDEMDDFIDGLFP